MACGPERFPGTHRSRHRADRRATAARTRPRPPAGVSTAAQHGSDEYRPRRKASHSHRARPGAPDMAPIAAALCKACAYGRARRIGRNARAAAAHRRGARCVLGHIVLSTLAYIHQLLTTGQRAAMREVFYQLEAPEELRDQDDCSRTIQGWQGPCSACHRPVRATHGLAADICGLLVCTRASLGISASTRGHIAGLVLWQVRATADRPHRATAPGRVSSCVPGQWHRDATGTQPARARLRALGPRGQSGMHACDALIDPTRAARHR